jgi:hypothetical protein
MISRFFLPAWFVGIILFMAVSPSIGRGESAIVVRDVDDKAVTLNPSQGVNLVVYTNGDLEKETRDLSKMLDPLRGRSDFQLVRVIDLRGEVAPAVRNLVLKKIRQELDKEAARLKPIYERNGRKNNPRGDMNAIADFGSGPLGKLHWNGYTEKLRAVVYKDGAEAKRFENAQPAEIFEHVKEQIGG